MSRPPLIDRQVIDELLLAIGEEGTRSVLELFVSESRGYLATIAEAAAPVADPAGRDRARRAAHSLKSGAGQLGFVAAAAAAEAVEEAATHSMPDLAQRIAALGQCATETLEALSLLLAEK